ncbi:hypothetical protein BC826DRAFT_1111099 [Russula brevipes]|nr:hypothetical protein BC826DRAFT_1111099 [Russula brevipes]
MSGSGGGGDGDDFGAWATNAPPPLGPPEKDEDKHAGRSPHRSEPSTTCAARPPTSGVGGAGEGDNFGTKLRPTPKNSTKPTEEEAAAMERWDHEDLVAAFLLTQCLPDTAAMHLEQFPTAQGRWSILAQEYMAKSAYAQNDLEDTFLEM